MKVLVEVERELARMGMVLGQDLEMLPELKVLVLELRKPGFCKLSW